MGLVKSCVHGVSRVLIVVFFQICGEFVPAGAEDVEARKLGLRCQFLSTIGSLRQDMARVVTYKTVTCSKDLCRTII